METTLEKIEVQTPATLLSQAIEKGLDVESLSKLMDLQERYQAGQARKLFFEAFTEFQSKCPDIRKTKEVNFGQTKYSFAPLADICRQIGKTLKDSGLSYRWEIQDNPTELKVTCLVSHLEGHTEQTTMQAAPDTSGAKNAIQARGSAIEYLKRYTLIGALGLSTADSDIDGRMPTEYDIDSLHKDYMSIYNQVILIDPTKNNWHPDNWKTERTGKIYVKAIKEIGKVLVELKNKGK
jgi:hypothetical protein